MDIDDECHICVRGISESIAYMLWNVRWLRELKTTLSASFIVCKSKPTKNDQ